MTATTERRLLVSRTTRSFHGAVPVTLHRESCRYAVAALASPDAADRVTEAEAPGYIGANKHCGVCKP